MTQVRIVDNWRTVCFQVVLAAVLATAAAEADPALLYSGYGYHGLGYSGLGYAGLGYTGLGYSGLAHTAYAAPLAYAHHGVYAPAGIKGPNYANDAVSAAGYAHKGQYIANSAGVVHIAKREAEAEADPALVYSNLGYSGLGYAGLGYAGLGYAGLPYAHGIKSAPCVNAANVPVACAGATYAPIGYHGLVHHSLGKREAEADPALVYSNLGYAGLGYAHHGYAGLHHTAYAGHLGYAGLTHPSNVGLCLNYVGQQVPC